MSFLKARNANYNALRKLSIRERIQAALDVSVGQPLIAMLTPTQAAELFPRYWVERNPNISGFLKAIPTSLSAAKQAAYEQQINNTASGDSAGANYNSSDYKRNWQKNMEEQRQRTTVSRKNDPPPPPQLTPEQKSAFEALKAGDIGVNDERMKWLKNAPEEVRKQVGINIVKDDKGNERYHYTAPQIRDEEVIANLRSAGNADKLSVDLIKKKEGFIPTPKFDVNHMRVGYGSDTITLADGTVKEVTPGMRVSREDAERDLLRRMPEFQKNGIIRYVGQDNWNRLNPQTKAALTSLAYNYGSIQKLTSLQDAIKNGNKEAIADAVASYANHKPYNSNGKPVNYDRRMEEANMIRGSTDSSVDPLTQNYTPNQIDARRQQMLTEKEAANLGSIAKAVQPNGPTNAAGPVPQGTDKWDSVAPLHSGSKGECGRGVASLALNIFGEKYGFNGHLNTGKASDLTKGDMVNDNTFTRSGLYKSGTKVGRESLTQDFLNSLPPGAIVASDGGGLSSSGAMNAGHIQMKVGGRWVSDFAQKGFLFGANRPGGEYSNFTVYYPTDKANQVLQEKGYVTGVQPTQMADIPVPKQSPPTPQTEEVGDNPNKASNSDRPTQADAQGIGSLKDAVQPNGPTNAMGPVAAQTPPATAQAPKSQPTNLGEKYKINMSAFREMVKKDPNNPYPGFLVDAASDQKIVEGFNSDPRIRAAGVNIDEKGILHIKDKNNPGVKDFMAGKDLSNVMTKIEEKKKEEEKTANVTPTKQATNVAHGEPGQPAQGEHGGAGGRGGNSAEPATRVKTAATGGEIPVNTDKIAAYPIGGLRGDNAVVVNAQQKPLFTMNTNESMFMDGDNKKAEIIPERKELDVPSKKETPSVSSGMMEEFQSDIQNIKQEFANLATNRPPVADTSGKTTPIMHERDWLDKLSQTTAETYKSPTARRVAYRANGMETGEPNSGFHYSHKNHS